MGNESSNSSSGSGFGQLAHDRVRRAAPAPPPPPPRRRRQTRRSQSAPGSLEKEQIQSDTAWNKEHADAQPVDLGEVDAAIRGCIAEFGPEPPRGGYTRAALHKLRGPNAPRDVAGRKRLMEMARHCDATSLQAGKVGGKRRRSRRKTKRRRTRKQRGGAPPAAKPQDRGYGRGFTRDVTAMDGQVQSETRFKTEAKAAPGAAPKKGGRRTRRLQRGGAQSSDATKPFDRGFGRGFTRQKHDIDGQVQSYTRFKSAPPKAPGAAPPKTGGGRKRRRRGTRRRRRHRGKDFDKELRRVIAQHRRYQIARGDKRFKATKGLIKWSRPNKTKRANRTYYRKRKSRGKGRRPRR